MFAHFDISDMSDNEFGTPRTINTIDNPDAECVCVRNHNPNAVQLHVHHIVPLGWGGEDVRANEMLLCPTTHDNVHRLLREYMRANGLPSWELRRHFGRAPRDIARQGWEGYRRGLQSRHVVVR